eukprot:GHUV01023365.1.p1 GENE.GHUV01023365.1~~GHUV01023365.1.p1  ORF type:complete len:297 (-),score=127.71 GHUV01023365.1:120-1010(-)
MSAAHMAYVWDHVVGGHALVPGVLFMEMAACGVQQALLSSRAASASAGLMMVSIPAACLLPDLGGASGDHATQVVLRCLVQPDSVRLASNRDTTGASRKPMVHLQAQPLTVLSTETTFVTAQDNKLSWLFRSVPTYKALVTPNAAISHQSAAAATAMIAPSVAPAAATAGCVDPSQLDALLQLAAVQRGALAPLFADQLQVPAAADLYTSAAAGTSQGNRPILAAAAVRSGLTAELMTADFKLQTAAAAVGGQTACSIVGLQARRATAAALVRQRGTAGIVQSKLQETDVEVSTLP